MKKPTLEEVRDYCESRDNEIDPEAFIDHYQSCGWVVGKNKPMKDWQASVRTWERNRKQKPVVKKVQQSFMDRLTDQSWAD